MPILNLCCTPASSGCCASIAAKASATPSIDGTSARRRFRDGTGSKTPRLGRAQRRINTGQSRMSRTRCGDRAGLSREFESTGRRFDHRRVSMGFPQENRSANSREKSYRRLNEKNGCGKGVQGSPSQWEPHPYARRSMRRSGVLGRWVSNYNV